VPTTAAASAATDEPTSSPREPGRRWRSSVSGGDAIFAAGLAGLLIYAFGLGRDLWFFSDDWDIIAFHHNGQYLVPYNGHLWLVPIGIFHTLYITMGLGSYAPYRVVGLISYAALGVVFFVYTRTRVPTLFAALASLSVVWFSTAHYNLLFPLLMNFSLPIACTVVIWMLLDRDTLRCDLGAGGFLAIALATNSVGLVTVAVVATELLFRRAPLRRWVPFIPPFALWLLWYAIYHTPVAGPGGGGAVARYALHEIQATFAGFAGGSDVGGYVLLAAAAVIFTLSIVRWHTFNARAAGALAAVGAFALLTSYTRAGFVPPVVATTPRYLWFNAFFLVAALVEVVRGLRLSWPVALAGAAIVIVGAITLVGNLQSYNRQVVTYKRTVRTYLVAVEAIPNRMNPRRTLPVSYIPVHVGQYLTAVHHLGSPIVGVQLRDLGTAHDRMTADGWMIHDLGLRFVPVRSSPSSACTSVQPATAMQGFDVRGPTTVVVHTGVGPAAWSIRRLATTFSPPMGRIPPGEIEMLRLPADPSTFPWHLRVQGLDVSVSTCA
jgi:hypothetical protein